MNNLKGEKSAYLKQHENNPVNWYPFGKTATDLAKKENKPIFLSIGYSSCHWCHVMAHESFEDETIAKYLNENFINIKVDREEYPDIDDYYQKACQRFGRNGGWPLSAFLLPNLEAFFVGTYFPNVPKYGQSSFLEVLQKINQAYKEDKEKLQNDASMVLESILKPEKGEIYKGNFPPPMSVLEALEQFQDNEYGGYGEAPKFPNFSFLEWSIEQIIEGKVDKRFSDHILKTVENMLFGGIYDHARGGIHRYSVKSDWMIPHFEKMLYDQAGLIKVLAKLGLIFPNPLIFDALFDTLEYLSKEMQSESGYFFSSQDADTEGEEGIYFTFTENEFDNVLEKDESLKNQKEKLKNWFGISTKGNFEKGLSVISLDPAFKEDFLTEEGWEIVRKVRKEIYNERKKRIPPGTDNKGIASWNFMLLSALCDVIQYCPIPPIKARAEALLNFGVKGSLTAFIIKSKEDDVGTAIRHSTTKEDSIPYFEDYVFFADTQLRLWEISGNADFKNNFFDCLQFIHSQFIENGAAKTRALTYKKTDLYPNLEVGTFESSFRSPLSMLINLTRRGEVLFAKRDFANNFEKIIENTTSECLRFPIAAGEALRALTYPKMAYRVVKVPIAWLNNENFINFIRHFTHRFVIDYHAGENQKWQICTLESCEADGEGIDKFISTLSPKKETIQ